MYDESKKPLWETRTSYAAGQPGFNITEYVYLLSALDSFFCSAISLIVALVLADLFMALFIQLYFVLILPVY